MPGDTEGGLLGGLLGSFAALAICLVLGVVFTIPHPKWIVRASWIFGTALIAAVLNFAIAFGGCALVMR